MSLSGGEGALSSLRLAYCEAARAATSATACASSVQAVPVGPFSVSARSETFDATAASTSAAGGCQPTVTSSSARRVFDGSATHNGRSSAAEKGIKGGRWSARMRVRLQAAQPLRP